MRISDWSSDVCSSDLEDAKRDLRGNRLAMIFQEPMTSLNPAFTIGDQIMEGLIRHKKLNREQARQAAIAMLRQVRIPEPAQRVDDSPNQLSGGMSQRAANAIPLARGQIGPASGRGRGCE